MRRYTPMRSRGPGEIPAALSEFQCRSSSKAETSLLGRRSEPLGLNTSFDLLGFFGLGTSILLPAHRLRSTPLAYMHPSPCSTAPTSQMSLWPTRRIRAQRRSRGLTRYLARLGQGGPSARQPSEATEQGVLRAPTGFRSRSSGASPDAVPLLSPRAPAATMEAFPVPEWYGALCSPSPPLSFPARLHLAERLKLRGQRRRFAHPRLRRAESNLERSARHCAWKRAMRASRATIALPSSRT